MRRRVAVLTCVLALGLTATAQAVTVRPVALPAGGPHGLAAISNTGVFVGARDCGYVGVFSLLTRSFTTQTTSGFPACTPDSGGDGRSVFDAAVGPDGRFWFTIYDSGEVGRIDANGTNFQKLAIGAHPLGLAAGPDNKMWVAVYGDGSPLSSKVVVVDPATFTADSTPVAGGHLTDVVPSPAEGVVYVLDEGNSQILRATPGASAPTLSPNWASGLMPSFGARSTTAGSG